MDTTLISIAAAITGGTAVALFKYFLAKTKKVDDMGDKYCTKDELSYIRTKLDELAERRSHTMMRSECSALRETCEGKKWGEAIQRLEETVDKKFSELSALIISVIRDNAGKK